MKEDRFEHSMLAPCGVNCAVCYKHLGKKPCGGCNSGNSTKTARCQSCAIKRCATQRGIAHCFVCDEFACKQVKALDKSYRTRYGASLIENGLAAKEQGIAVFLEQQRIAFACAFCGGVISLQDGRCSECKAEAPSERTKTGK